MGELFSRPVWEIILLFIVAFGGVGGIVWLIFTLFKPKHIGIGKVDISNEQTPIEEKKNTEDRDLKLVINQAVFVGFEICKLKLVDIIQIQDQFANQKIEALNLYMKEEFLKMMHKKTEYKENQKDLKDKNINEDDKKNLTLRNKKLQLKMDKQP